MMLLIPCLQWHLLQYSASADNQTRNIRDVWILPETSNMRYRYQRWHVVTSPQQKIELLINGTTSTHHRFPITVLARTSFAPLCPPPRPRHWKSGIALGHGRQSRPRSLMTNRNCLCLFCRYHTLLVKPLSA
ncbi:hypothetical protein QBC32DRAFT_94835 [Pseudoneurospora amorphoporcata]|uniref:Secreted protein n=1 Tax=Pseudoneurospora amorphoporcata TaxID=241081 RepID=A0AAN6SHV2_9PEZI|nr:hypothetical protein QBC32DRAFT_94835 [Pseudoneurospora amorphoporcata]